MRRMILAAILCFALTMPAIARGPEDSSGWSVWALAGEDSQEARVGYRGLLPDVELALGLVHEDAPAEEIEEWPIRVYGIAHALDADMIASALGHDWQLPEGNLYAGGFLEYTRDRAEEWAGGYVIGGLVDWPRGWQTVAEYQAALWNTDAEDYRLVVGFRREF